MYVSDKGNRNTGTVTATEADLDSLAGPIVIAIGIGALAAMLLLASLAPDLVQSLTGPQPHAYWYLSRASGVVSYVLIWASMALGVSITNKLARLWPGGPAAFDLHQYLSVLGLSFAAFHVLVLLGDKFIGYDPFQLLVPFASTGYRLFWVALGQIAIYLLIIVTFSFYIRKQIGIRWWRYIHYTSFGVFVLVLVHSIFSGTDTGVPVVSWLYWITGGTLLFLTIYRVLSSAPATAKQS